MGVHSGPPAWGGPSLSGDRPGPLLSAPPEVSPLLEAHGMSMVSHGLGGETLILGTTSALLQGSLIWLHEIVFLKYGVRRGEQSLTAYSS